MAVLQIVWILYSITSPGSTECLDGGCGIPTSRNITTSMPFAIGNHSHQTSVIIFVSSILLVIIFTVPITLLVEAICRARYCKGMEGTSPTRSSSSKADIESAVRNHTVLTGAVGHEAIIASTSNNESETMIGTDRSEKNHLDIQVIYKEGGVDDSSACVIYAEPERKPGKTRMSKEDRSLSQESNATNTERSQIVNSTDLGNSGIVFPHNNDNKQQSEAIYAKPDKSNKGTSKPSTGNESKPKSITDVSNASLVSETVVNSRPTTYLVEDLNETSSPRRSRVNALKEASCCPRNMNALSNDPQYSAVSLSSNNEDPLQAVYAKPIKKIIDVDTSSELKTPINVIEQCAPRVDDCATLRDTHACSEHDKAIQNDRMSLSDTITRDSVTMVMIVSSGSPTRPNDTESVNRESAHLSQQDSELIYAKPIKNKDVGAEAANKSNSSEDITKTRLSRVDTYATVREITEPVMKTPCSSVRRKTSPAYEDVQQLTFASAPSRASAEEILHAEGDLTHQNDTESVNRESAHLSQQDSELIYAKPIKNKDVGAEAANKSNSSEDITKTRLSYGDTYATVREIPEPVLKTPCSSVRRKTSPAYEGVQQLTSAAAPSRASAEEIHHAEKDLTHQNDTESVNRESAHASQQDSELIYAKPIKNKDVGAEAANKSNSSEDFTKTRLSYGDTYAIVREIPGPVMKTPCSSVRRKTSPAYEDVQQLNINPIASPVHIRKPQSLPSNGSLIRLPVDTSVENLDSIDEEEENMEPAYSITRVRDTRMSTLTDDVTVSDQTNESKSPPVDCVSESYYSQMQLVAGNKPSRVRKGPRFNSGRHYEDEVMVELGTPGVKKPSIQMPGSLPTPIDIPTVEDEHQC